MKHKPLTIAIMIFGVGVPLVVMTTVIFAMMMGQQDSLMYNWLFKYYRKIWYLVGGGGSVVYLIGLILWSASSYDESGFRFWLLVNIVLMVLAYAVFPFVGPILAVVQGVMILYRATRLRRIYTSRSAGEMIRE